MKSEAGRQNLVTFLLFTLGFTVLYSLDAYVLRGGDPWVPLGLMLPLIVVVSAVTALIPTIPMAVARWIMVRRGCAAATIGWVSALIGSACATAVGWAYVNGTGFLGFIVISVGALSLAMLAMVVSRFPRPIR